MTDLLVVRHAQCDHVGRRLVGRMEGVTLNDTGRRQARDLAALLASRTLHAVYASPLTRALDTARLIARPHHLPVEPRAALTDIDFGEWTGATMAALQRDARWHAFNERRSTGHAPGGERMIDVQARAVSELLRLAALHVGQCIAIVSHADVIRSMLLHVLGMPLDAIHRIEVGPASVSHVQLEGPVGRVLALNALALSPLTPAAPSAEPLRAIR